MTTKEENLKKEIAKLKTAGSMQATDLFEEKQRVITMRGEIQRLLSIINDGQYLIANRKSQEAYELLSAEATKYAIKDYKFVLPEYGKTKV